MSSLYVHYNLKEDILYEKIDGRRRKIRRNNLRKKILYKQAKSLNICIRFRKKIHASSNTYDRTMKKPPTIKHLKRICTKCKNSQELWGNRYCRLIKPNFNENGACMEFVQAPKQNEKYEQLSLFDED